MEWGVTELFYSDREPYEIIKIKDDKHITIRRLDYKRIDGGGMSENQKYEYYQNENNGTKELYLNKNGQWREHKNCNGFMLGRAEHYYDYSF